MSCCPLCGDADIVSYCQDRQRSYQQCESCQLVFVDRTQHLPATQEKAIYDLHQNDSTDLGYRKFLSRLYQPLAERLPANACGLDFGCGPGPVLAEMFADDGYSMSVYDLYYARNKNVLVNDGNNTYNFIVATEVVEHLTAPGVELQRLWALLKPGGLLGLMTKLVVDSEAFKRWHYKNDLTHISFFSRYTFQHLGRQWGVEPEFIGNDVMLFQKSELCAKQ